MFVSDESNLCISKCMWWIKGSLGCFKHAFLLSEESLGYWVGISGDTSSNMMNFYWEYALAVLTL